MLQYKSPCVVVNNAMSITDNILIMQNIQGLAVSWPRWTITTTCSYPFTWQPKLHTNIYTIQPLSMRFEGNNTQLVSSVHRHNHCHYHHHDRCRRHHHPPTQSILNHSQVVCCWAEALLGWGRKKWESVAGKVHVCGLGVLALGMVETTCNTRLMSPAADLDLDPHHEGEQDWGHSAQSSVTSWLWPKRYHSHSLQFWLMFP